jgi:hypothetical protein
MHSHIQTADTARAGTVRDFDGQKKSDRECCVFVFLCVFLFNLVGDENHALKLAPQKIEKGERMLLVPTGKKIS